MPCRDCGSSLLIHGDCLACIQPLAALGPMSAIASPPIVTLAFAHRSRRHGPATEVA